MDRIIRVFPSRTKWTPTDARVFTTDPPLFVQAGNKEIPLLEAYSSWTPIRVSVAFTWDCGKGERLARSWSRFFHDVQIGGPALDHPGGDFEPGMFVKKGMIVTSRGCPKNCPWCIVPRREGPIRELPIVEGHNIFDNNLLACSRPHIEAVFEMLRGQKEPALFSGGLDAGLLQPWHVDLLKTVRKDAIYVACDTIEAFPILERAADLLSDFPRSLKYSYVLVGLNGETTEQAEDRLIRTFLLGFIPRAMYYRGLESKSRMAPDPKWRKLIRKWQAPARLKAFMKGLQEGDLRQEATLLEAL